ncbi:MAG TPA: hypothetical protein VK774_03700 [Solirubrobacteraceae bacterium]|jgi:hypothetical protein|nr:hypothetical protein [Solirubrobacteraceae bacterium]
MAAASAHRQPHVPARQSAEAEPAEHQLELAERWQALAERRVTLTERRFGLTERRFMLLIYGVLLMLTAALVIVAIVCALRGDSPPLSSAAAGPGAVAAMRLVLADRAKR